MTRRVLERVPDDKFSWKPHDKSFSMGDLASHITNMIKWTDPTMNQTEFDLASVPMEEMNKAAKSNAELLSWFDANVAAVRPMLTRPDADYFVPWTLRQGAKVSSRCRATPASAASASTTSCITARSSAYACA